MIECGKSKSMSCKLDESEKKNKLKAKISGHIFDRELRKKKIIRRKEKSFVNCHGE